MENSLPSLEQLTHMFDQATTPTFFLFAIAALVGRMNTRLTDVTNAIAALRASGAPAGPRLDLLRRRSALLCRGIHHALLGALLTVVLLVELFLAAFLHFGHAYGAALLFILSAIMLGAGLFAFAQESRLAIRQAALVEQG